MTLQTISRVARRAGLSRTALLYYESVGLLRPAARSASGYRLYGEREAEQLRMVRVYREAGLPIDTIKTLLARDAPSPALLLERRLLQLNQQVDRLREQQRTLARLLARPDVLTSSTVRTKAQWVQLLRSAGLGDLDMQRWHAAFEAQAPQDHQAFLEALGLAADEIAAIRSWSMASGDRIV